MTPPVLPRRHLVCLRWPRDGPIHPEFLAVHGRERRRGPRAYLGGLPIPPLAERHRVGPWCAGNEAVPAQGRRRGTRADAAFCIASTADPLRGDAEDGPFVDHGDLQHLGHLFPERDAEITDRLEDLFRTDLFRWERLAATLQRPLWASTSSENPAGHPLRRQPHRARHGEHPAGIGHRRLRGPGHRTAHRRHRCRERRGRDRALGEIGVDVDDVGSSARGPRHPPLPAVLHGRAGRLGGKPRPPRSCVTGRWSETTPFRWAGLLPLREVLEALGGRHSDARHSDGCHPQGPVPFVLR